MKRICVIGTSGSGKTILSKTLAQHLRLPFVDSDSFYWQADWQPASQEVLREKIFASAVGQSWVFDGNYLSLRHFVWRRADTVVWLDFSLSVVLRRVCWRNARRIIRGEQLWNGNHENWCRAWSGVRHTWSTHKSKERNYPKFLAEFPHLQIIRLRSPRQVKRWLNAI
jgi:hypothetical protein